MSNGDAEFRPDDGDPLGRMRAYQLARSLLAAAWSDAERLRHHRVTGKVAGQLYAAVGSIAANIGEGYSRSSGRDRARIFEYALGSVRESMTWYESARPVLGADLVSGRLNNLEEIRRLLLAIIPASAIASSDRQRLDAPHNPGTSLNRGWFSVRS